MSVSENVTKQVCANDHFIGKYSFLLINQFIHRENFFDLRKYTLSVMLSMSNSICHQKATTDGTTEGNTFGHQRAPLSVNRRQDYRSSEDNTFGHQKSTLSVIRWNQRATLSVIRENQRATLSAIRGNQRATLLFVGRNQRATLLIIRWQHYR